jgi:hypothetical protein
MSPVRRWPLHPQPGAVEALSSWLTRLAAPYDLSAVELLRHNLGTASSLLTAAVLADLDWDPPTEVLTVLAERTGVGVAALRTMTMAGWVPWLTDTLSPGDALDAQELFDTYVRQHSVLLIPGQVGRNRVHRWRGPWMTAPGPASERRVCPICATDPQRGTALVWRLPITISCPEHACRLKPEFEVKLALAQQTPMPTLSVGEHVAALDRLTHEGLITGRVGLPGHSVHVGVWFRLLRTLLDELSISPSRVGVRSRDILNHVWATVGGPVRAGLTAWRPFEQLDWPAQQSLLEAAAVALHLVQTGVIVARGTLGAALTVESHHRVYDGDEQAYRLRESWDELNAMVVAARTDRDTARRFLGWFPSSADWVRRILLDAGVPAEFLTLTEPESEPATRALPSSHISGPLDPSREIDCMTG